MARGKQLGRVLRLKRLLARPEGISAIAASRELGCTRRTIYRDMQLLEREGYTLYGDEEGAGGIWHMLAPGATLESAPFTRDELSALWLARESLTRLTGTPLAEGARTAVEKLQASLTLKERKRVERVVCPKSAAADAPVAAARTSSRR